jgi:hypothetical protein
MLYKSVTREKGTDNRVAQDKQARLLSSDAGHFSLIRYVLLKQALPVSQG